MPGPLDRIERHLEPWVIRKFTLDQKNVTTSSTEVMAANEKRKYASFVNASDAVITLSPGIPAVALTGTPLEPHGGVEEYIRGQNLWLGAVYAIHEGTGNKVLSTKEGE